MSQTRRHCAVLGCMRVGDLSFHKFPNPKKELDLFKDWVALTGNISLLEDDPLSVSNRRICSVHFSNVDVLHTKLMHGALPTLNLPSPIEVPHDWLMGSSLETVPSPLLDEFWGVSYNTLSKDGSPRKRVSPRQQITSEENILQISEVTMNISPQFEQPSTYKSTSFSAGFSTLDPGKTQEMTDVSSLKQHKFAFDKDAVPKQLRRKRISPEIQNYLMKIKQLKRKYYHCNKKKLSYKKRLSEVLKQSTFLEGLPPKIFQFIESQFRNIGRKKNGRIFTLQDKVLALTFYKNSPKSYKLLSRLFMLPCISSLRALIHNISVTPGIIDNVFEELKLRAFHMKERDRICVLLFDEMSVSSHLNYIKHKDMIKGFQDDGDTRYAEFANHVQVYMLRGIYKKWKIPVAYAFCKSTMSVANIVRFYKTIVQKSHNAGFSIIASVCDQGATNIKALKMLKEETRAAALRHQREAKENVIEIGNQIIIPLFDPPYLLKCIKNNMLTKNLKFVQDGQIKVAKWSHLITAYHIDAGTGKFRIMPKLTDTHIIPSKIKKMKVSICAQVFSKSVAAALSFMSNNECISIDNTKKMPREGQDTAELCFFF